MTYKEKKTLVSILTGALLIAIYCIYATGKVQSGAATLVDLKFWATTILAFIGIGIIAMIVILIVFHILFSIEMTIRERARNGKHDEKSIGKSIELEMVDDEMDKLIELKSTRIGFAIVGIGFTAALGSLALGWPAAVMLNILFGSFVVSMMMEGFAQIHYYRKGIKNS